MVELYDKVELQDGRIGFVVFILDESNFMIEITENHRVITVSSDKIKKSFKRHRGGING